VQVTSTAKLCPQIVVPLGRMTSCEANSVPEVSTRRMRIWPPIAPVKRKQSISPLAPIDAAVGAAPKVSAGHVAAGGLLRRWSASV
jgi:hypothetical protein